MSEANVQEQAINLFMFLKEIAKMRSKTICNLEKYDSVIWFENIPENDRCVSVFDSPEGERKELWLEVEQPRIPSPPRPPEELDDWIIAKEMNNPGLDHPQLRDSISRRKKVGDIQYERNPRPYKQSVHGQDNSIEFEAKEKANRRPAYIKEITKLEDRPQLLAKWEEYLNKKWCKWSRKVKEHVPALNLYDQLFDMHHILQKVAENYEILVCFGCLSFKTPSGQEVYRHILSSRVSLHFDSSRGAISIISPSDGYSYTLEQDMLEMNERPSVDVRQGIEELLDALNEDFWNQDKIDHLLGAYVRGLSSRGVYSSSLHKPEKPSENPQISFAPAIVLRQRTDIYYVRLFEEIINQLESSGEIPLGVERLVSIKDDEIESTEHDFNESNENKISASSKNKINALNMSDSRSLSEYNSSDFQFSDGEIYFPLVSNPDQKEIAEKLRSRQGVLVQGPPGTGKSHTIINLVCHLLAEGKRVLVTSHTPRALTVLRDKFPDSLKDLCVSIVGDDYSESKQALEDSVTGITNKHQNWNPHNNQKQITEARVRLDELRQSELWILNSLRRIKEKDTLQHENKFGSYSGTAQEIAKKLSQEAKSYSWLESRPDEDERSPLTNKQAVKLLGLFVNYSPEKEAEIAKETIPLEKLVPPATFTKLVTRSKSLNEKLGVIENLTSHESYKASTNLNKEDRESLVLKLDELIRLYQRIAKRPEPFAATAAREITADHDRKWRDLLEVTKENLKVVNEDYKLIAQKTVSGIENRDLMVMKGHAEKLRDHLTEGGSLGFGIFRKKAVKEALYIIESVYVEGELCDNSQSINELIEWLQLAIVEKKLKQQWEDFVNETPSSLIGSIATFLDYCEPLEEALQLWEKMKALRYELDKHSSIIAPDWECLDSIKEFRDIIDGGSVEEELTQLGAKFQELENISRTASNSPTSHKIVSELYEAIATRNDESYHKLFKENDHLLEEKGKVEYKYELYELLKQQVPSVAQKLNSHTAKEPVWKTRFKTIEQAWQWAQASNWIEHLSNPTHFIKLTKDLEQMQADIRRELGNLAELNAWKHTFERLDEEQRQHLIAWSMAIRRIGKGKGKYVEKYRREAKSHMSYCRSAIPAWIMPIHKVVESVKPGSDVFDVIIVDEASQSGPEALFLLYMGKQLVVVGDDKQISPEFVGFDKASVELLRKEFLGGIPHNDAIGVEHSFFDQAKIRYKGKISLKEHFRCMPEIIQFSNKLCYRSEPLIPLRQYGGNRLSPVIEANHISNGYVDESRRSINKPEADAILMHLKEICEDSNYRGKTIGIISLLNTSGQADYIEKELLKYVSKEEVESRKIRIGDAYLFQGDERDVIFLSMVAAASDERTLRALTSDKYERSFNVAVSRARDQLLLYHSVSLNELNPKCIRHKLISYCQNPSAELTDFKELDLDELARLLEEGHQLDTHPPEPFDSWFEVDVFIRIARRGYRVIPQVEMNGYLIDLIVEGLKGRIAVECDGDKWHSTAEHYDRDTARQRDLERCGLRFCRIKGSAFYHKPEEALEELWNTLERYEIYPKQ